MARGWTILGYGFIFWDIPGYNGYHGINCVNTPAGRMFTRVNTSPARALQWSQVDGDHRAKKRCPGRAQEI
eukprot:96355-Prymnesium_polylepis.1